MKDAIHLPKWTIVLPILAWIGFAGKYLNFGEYYFFILAVLLIGSVISAVHHAEVVAHKIGEPLGTLVLAVSVTVIEVGLIVSLMLAGGADASTYARDTIYAAIMIILTGIVGMSLLLGGIKHMEQKFVLKGVSTALVALTAIITLTLILPNYTVSVRGPYFNTSQLIFISVVSVIIYITFVLVQTVRHRDYFLPSDEREDKGLADLDAEESENIHVDPPNLITTWLSFILLLISLGVVIMLGKALSPTIEEVVKSLGAPKALVGVIIAGVVLLPEAIAAIKAAAKNKLQTSLNLAFGSALASIGLTIPTIAIVSLLTDMKITLGLNSLSTILITIAVFINTLSLSNGRTNILQGVVLLVLFATYLFTTIVP